VNPRPVGPRGFPCGQNVSAASSLLGAPPLLQHQRPRLPPLLNPSRPSGPRGVSHEQNEPVASSLLGMPPHLMRQRPQVPLQTGQLYRVPQMPQQLFHPPHQQLRPSTASLATTVRNVYQSDSTLGVRAGMTSALGRGSSSTTRGGRGRGGQQVTVTHPAPTVDRRCAEKTREIRERMLEVFPQHSAQVDDILQQNPCIYSVDELCLKIVDND